MDCDKSHRIVMGRGVCSILRGNQSTALQSEVVPPPLAGAAARAGGRTGVVLCACGAAMDREQAFREAIGAVYEAALDPALWGAALAKIAASLDARSATAFVVDLADAAVGFAALHNIEPRGLDDYRAHFARIDPWNAYLDGAPAGRPIVSQMAMEDGPFARTEFCHDFLRPQQIFHALGGFVLRRGSLAFLCGVHRPRVRGAFGPAEMERLQALFPHLARAAHIYRRMTLAGGLADGLKAALERMPVGAILADAMGRVLWCNRQAEDCLRRAEGLRLGLIDRRLESVASTSLTHQLRRLIAGAGGSGEGGGATGARKDNGAGKGQGLNGKAALESPLPQRNGAAIVAPPGTGPMESRLPLGKKARVRGLTKKFPTAPYIRRSTPPPDDLAGTLLLPRPWPRKPLTLTVAPLPPEAASRGPDLELGAALPAALLIIADPERAPKPAPARLMQCFGFTAAEARLAAALAGGTSLAEYAESAQITLGTARWYLKQALSKSGTHRQSELMRQVVGTGAGAID